MRCTTGLLASARTHGEVSSWGSAGAFGWSRSTDSLASPAWGGTWSSWGASWDGNRSAIQQKSEEAEGLAGGSASSLPPSVPVASSEWRTGSWAGGATWTGDGLAWGSGWSSWGPRCSGQEVTCSGIACAEANAPKAVNTSPLASDLASSSHDAGGESSGTSCASGVAEAADRREIGAAIAGDRCAAAYGRKPSVQRVGGRSLPPPVSGRSPVKPEGGSLQADNPVAEQEFEVLFLGGQMVKVPKKKPGPALGSRSGGTGGSKGSQGQSRRLLVSGLSSSTTTDSLAAHFRTVGRVLHTSLVAGSASGRVEFADEDGAQRASCELNDSLLDSSKITIQMPTNTTAARSKSVGGRFTSVR